MDPEQEELFHAFEGFRKLNLAAMLPNLSHGDFCILKIIHNCGEEHPGKEVRVAEVVERMHMAPPAVSRSMKSLEERGYILRSTNPKDRRNVHIELTDEGKQILQEAEETLQQFTDAVFSQMDKETMKRLIQYLKKLQAVMAEEIKQRKYFPKEKNPDGMQSAAGQTE